MAPHTRINIHAMLIACLTRPAGLREIFYQLFGWKFIVTEQSARLVRAAMRYMHITAIHCGYLFYSTIQIDIVIRGISMRELIWKIPTKGSLILVHANTGHKSKQCVLNERNTVASIQQPKNRAISVIFWPVAFIKQFKHHMLMLCRRTIIRLLYLVYDLPDNVGQ